MFWRHFLDEAYALMKRGKQGYGAEFLDQLMELTDKEDYPVMIFAGYNWDMEDFIKMNMSLRRWGKISKLEPFTDEEMQKPEQNHALELAKDCEKIAQKRISGRKILIK